MLEGVADRVAMVEGDGGRGWGSTGGLSTCLVGVPRALSPVEAKAALPHSSGLTEDGPNGAFASLLVAVLVSWFDVEA